jgi:NAD(P)H-nitrite reductase large subunit
MNKEFFQQIDQVNELISDHLYSEKLDDETLICECFCINVADIRRACAGQQAVNLELLSTDFNLGKSCRSCLDKKSYWISRVF